MRMVRYESAAWVSGALWGTMADEISSGRKRMSYMGWGVAPVT